MLKLVVENNVVVGCDLDIKSVVLPENINTIGRAAFYESDLEEIVLNDGLKTIASLAFLGTAIKMLYIPESVTTIEAGFVSGCNFLESIVVNENNKNYYSIDNCLVERKTNKVIAIVGDAIVPNNITAISALAFYGRIKNITVEIPESVTKIGKTEFNFPPHLEFPITIKAKKDSYAIEFAKENEIEYAEK